VGKVHDAYSLSLPPFENREGMGQPQLGSADNEEAKKWASPPVQFMARENDGTGLYFYRTRYYSPTFGRFASEDPSGFAGGLNLLAFVRDNPTNFTDPLGLKAQEPPKTEEPPKREKPPSCHNPVKDAAAAFAISEAAGIVGGCLVGGLVGAGFTVATDTFPFAGQGAVSGCLAGAIALGVDFLPYSLAGAIGTAVYSHYTDPCR
jgi:RHS repeat-associated protein